MLHTMERIAGIPPMTQFDAEAPLMTNSFTASPNFAPYAALTPSQNMGEKNPAGNPLAGKVTATDFVKEDLVEPQLLNTMIWQSVKGDTPMPAPHTIFANSHESPGGSGGDLHAGPQGDGTGVTPRAGSSPPPAPRST